MVQIAWGGKVSTMFLDRVAWIVDVLEIGASAADGMSNLMTCIAWESGRTFSASVTNKAGSGATGLIQFMPDTAKKLGTTVEALAKMKAEDQLNYVWKYFEPYKGKLKTLSDLYMAILWPKAIGKPETYVLWGKGGMPTTYRQNAGLDINKDGDIIKAEATAKLTAMLAEGMKDANTAEYGAKVQAFVTEPPVQSPNTLVDLASVGEVLAPAATAVSSTIANTVSETAAANLTELAKQLPRSTVNEVLAKAPASIVEHVTEATKLKLGEKSTWIGAAITTGAVLADPSVQAAITPAITAIKHGSFGGILAAVIGLGMVIARSKATPRTDSMIAAKRLTDPG